VCLGVQLLIASGRGIRLGRLQRLVGHARQNTPGA
jgi:hypothetical protein